MSLTTAGTQERRRLSLSAASAEIRTTRDDEAEERRFHGYAAVFNSRAAIGNPLRWGFYEEIADGAFTKTLTEGDARFLIDHDSYYVVSRVSADTLGLAQDKTGLAVDSALDTRLSYVNDLIANLDNRNVTGMSFGFYVVKDDWTLEEIETSDGQTAEVEVRTIREVRLIEVSAVTFPAYDDTEAALRHVATALVHRGDPAAVERRAAYRPELRDILQVIEREPGEPTRADAPTEPAAATPRHVDQVDLAMRGMAARYRLPLS
jgi:HK97 family phage prohead protease